MHQRVFRTQQVRVTHRAAHDAAQNIAATVVRRHHAIGDQEGCGPQVIGDHTVVRFARTIGIGRRGISRRFDQRAHKVGVVVVVLALQQRANPFQPHACIDGLHIQRAHRAILELLVLHENDVPDFDETVAVFFGRSRRATPDVVAVIVEDLSTRAAGAGRAHLPEVVGRRDANDPVFRNADFLPDFKGFIIGVIDGGQQARLVDGKVFGDQLIGKGDCFGLEVIAERKVAQHFKERVVACGVADVIKVVVLTTGANTFLRCCRAGVVAGFDACEQVLELHHARVRKQQRRVVAGHKRGRGHDRVPLFFEIAQKGRADIVQRCHALPRVAKILSDVPLALGAVHRGRA